MVDSTLPSIEELFGPKPARPAHPKIVAASKALSDSGRLAMEVAEREIVRLLATACFRELRRMQS